jgi:putative GTP-binding protein
MGQFKVVLVTGARQVGKTTMLQHVLPENFRYVTLDDPRAGVLAREDPVLFFDANRLPVAVDEVQRVPELFQQVKFLVDQSPEVGRVVLTGSQAFQLMQGVSESLAGRVAILEMTGMSLRELTGCGGRGPYVPSEVGDDGRCESPEGLDLWATIHRGSMPRLMDPSVSWDAFYTGYVRTYLERDVRDLITVKDEASFYHFLVACAARTGRLVNHSALARDAGVDTKTAQSWLSVLQASGVVRLLRPFWSNATKRLTKTPKLYFTDTGLACHLLGWSSPETLRRGAMAGHVFETFVVGEVVKSYLNAGGDARNVHFYRDARQREIDLIIQEGRVLHPVEIKTSATVTREAVAGFSVLADVGDYDVGAGAIICQTREPYPVTATVKAVPVWSI